jgi:hypothetical protein
MKPALDLGDHFIGPALQIDKPVVRGLQAAQRFVRLETQGARCGSVWSGSETP